LLYQHWLYQDIGIGSGPKCDGLTPDPYLAGKAGREYSEEI
jgi:hypothetical protein